MKKLIRITSQVFRVLKCLALLLLMYGLELVNPNIFVEVLVGLKMRI